METKDKSVYEMARAVVTKGLYNTDDFQLCALAAEQMKAPKDSIDRKIQDMAYTHKLVVESTRPMPPSPYDAEIEQLRAEMESAIAAQEDAKAQKFWWEDELDALQVADYSISETGARGLLYRRKDSSPAKIAEARERAQDAHVEWRDACVDERHVRAAYHSMCKKRDDYLRHVDRD